MCIYIYIYTYLCIYISLSLYIYIYIMIYVRFDAIRELVCCFWAAPRLCDPDIPAATWVNGIRLRLWIWILDM